MASHFDYRKFGDREESFINIVEPERSGPNVQNLDKFLSRVYNYYHGKGFNAILLSRLLNLITLALVVIFIVFFVCWVDYDTLFTTFELTESIKYQGIPWWLGICVFIFLLFWSIQVLLFIRDIWEYWSIRKFYTEDLKISERTLQTAQWHEVTAKIVQLPYIFRASNQITALDIANRIMRKENYMIAMINKDVLSLRLPIPGIASRSVMTHELEWLINFAISHTLFSAESVQGLNQEVLQPGQLPRLAERLRRWFWWLGVCSLVLSPFVFVYLLIYSVFKYGEELRSKPQILGHRTWSALARWKFRELNELPHVLHRRLRASYMQANLYVGCFSSLLLTIVARFVAFVCGSVLVVLLALSVWNDDALIQLNIAGKSALWYIGILGSVIAVSRGLIPDETASAEPEVVMREIELCTHYMPDHWKGRTHTLDVLDEFQQLYEYAVVVYLIELLGVLFSPFVLMFELTKSADGIVRFFHEYTIAQPGVGNICKYAVFPLEELGSREYLVDSRVDVRSADKQTRFGKLEKSFINFADNHPEWKPPEAGRRYLDQLANLTQMAKTDDGFLAKSNLANSSLGARAQQQQPIHLSDGNLSNSLSSSRLGGSRVRDSILLDQAIRLFRQKNDGLDSAHLGNSL
eukprot:TRINITY_DN10769_c0_g1_i1.p1 TRINITY_DN10769_c0_g1~~TRINITY_DN10769_c0_g1_i1.p1  ORF type:complete len:636 (+),score=181.83 TRINITY_DN10769_c0_g1_i1:90-1997(+)